jgi:general nucleoside transport system permease protein
MVIIYHLPTAKYIITMMVVSGAIAGLAGFIQVSAIEGRLRFPISVEYGYTGFLVSWLARHKPLLIIPIAILMAGLLTGGDNVQIIQKLPFAFVKILQGIIFIIFLFINFSSYRKKTV